MPRTNYRVLATRDPGSTRPVFCRIFARQEDGAEEVVGYLALEEEEAAAVHTFGRLTGELLGLPLKWDGWTPATDVRLPAVFEKVQKLARLAGVGRAQ